MNEFWGFDKWINCKTRYHCLLYSAFCWAMESEDSCQELYITQSSPQRERNLAIGDDCNLEALSSVELNRDVWDINIDEEHATSGSESLCNAGFWHRNSGKDCRDSVPKSTKYKDKWAVNMFKNWRQQRNKKVYNVGEGSDCLAGLQIIQIA